MSEKKKSIILSVKLDTPTYKNEEIKDLSFVNFFYGNNGTGKTTIATKISNKDGLTIDPSEDLENYNLYSYNSDFIKNNFSLKDKVKAIYTLGSPIVKNQKMVDDANDEIKKNKRTINSLSVTIDTVTKTRESTINSFQELIWKNSKNQREFFSQYVSGLKGNKADFAREILNKYRNHIGSLISNYDDLKNKIETAFKADNTDYPLFKFTVPPLPDDEGLLNTSLFSSDSSEFARFVKSLNNLNWVQHGHDNYTNPDNKCPYCQRELPDDFEENYKTLFDSDYQEAIGKLKTYQNKYSESLNAIITELNNNLLLVLQELDLNEYKANLSSLEAKFQKNIDIIKGKIEKPYTKVSLLDINQELEKIAGLIPSINEKIKSHKQIVANSQNIKNNLYRDAISYLTFMLTNEIESYLGSLKSIDEQINQREEERKKLINRNIELNDQIKELGARTVDAGPVVEQINETIKHSGFQGFRLIWDENDKGSYQVVYTNPGKDGKPVPATKLSEGETNFIAFLYFYFMVVNTDETGATKDSIVIIDDPVSSMDSQTLFIVSSLVKNLIDRCINSSTIQEGSPIKENNIAQLFILTHNVYFHANITSEYEERYDAVNYYQVMKNSNLSKVKLCVKTNRDGLKINYNPIKNSYAALWHELDEVQTSISACNIIHRILGYYFLNLCGYKNKTLEEKLLKEHATRFLKDKDGNDTQEIFNLVRSFLEYLGHSQNLVGNEVYFEDGLDVETCKETLKLIFDAMGQSQHYAMMTKSAKPQNN